MAIERVELPAKSRRPRTLAPRYIIIHTTQGQTTIERQYQATVNWMRAGGAQGLEGSWGPSCDIVIGHDGREAWFTANGIDYHGTRANWSAGYGASSVATYGADEYGIAIELAQTNKGEKPPAVTMRAAAERCAALCREFKIEPTRIAYLSQVRIGQVPTGIVGHEDTENGRKTGKWDPNKTTFPWAGFIEAVRTIMLDDTEEPMAESNAYIVAKGDTLGAIAERFGQTAAELAERNDIANPNVIAVGQVLRLTDDAPMPLAPPVDLAKVRLEPSGTAQAHWTGDPALRDTSQQWRIVVDS